MASGHMNRVKRPDTWLHRPMLQNVKKVLANPEPSTHDPTLKSSFIQCPASRQSCPADLTREPTRQVRTEPYRSVMEKRGSSPKPLRRVSVVASGATTQWRLTWTPRGSQQ